MTEPIRIHCSVPFCKRTRGQWKCDEFTITNDMVWLCGAHWRMASPHLRRRESKLSRLYRRRFGRNAYWAYPGGSPESLEALKLGRLRDLAWERCERSAIERAAGL